MEMFNSVAEALEKYPDAHVSFPRIGTCMVCKEKRDLRCGSCFSCSPKIDGEPIKGGHRLWERANPSNTWYVGNR